MRGKHYHCSIDIDIVIGRTAAVAVCRVSCNSAKLAKLPSTAFRRVTVCCVLYRDHHLAHIHQSHPISAMQLNGGQPSDVASIAKLSIDRRGGIGTSKKKRKRNARTVEKEGVMTGRREKNGMDGKIGKGASYILFVAQMHKLRHIIVKVMSKALSDIVK